MHTSLVAKNAKGKKTTLWQKILFGLLAIYLVGVMAIMFGGLTAMIVKQMQPIGMEWLALALGALMSIALCFITMIFTMQSQIFGAKDNDLLLAMPIKPAVIAGSRVLSLLLLEYVYNAVVLIPVMVVYAVLVQPSWSFYVLFTLGALLLPLIPLAFAGFVAYALAVVSSKVKFKNLIIAVLSCGFFGVYMYACLNLQKYMLILVEKGEQIAGVIQKAMPPIYHFANMAQTGSLWSLLVVLVWCLLPISVFLWLMSKGFMKYSNASRGTRAIYKKRPMKSSRPWMAIFKKEIAKISTCPTYLFNTGFGVVLVVAMSAYLLVKGSDSLTQILAVPQFMQFLPQAALAMLCFVAGISCTTAPSISLEGNNFWILRATPIEPTEVFKGKIALNLMVTIPAMVISVLLCAPVLKLDLLNIVVLILVPSALSLFVAMMGLYVNLIFPRFDYPSDAHAVKQGMSVMIMSFGGMGIVFIPAALYGFWLRNIISFNVFGIDLFVFLAIACFGMWQVLKKDGVRRFESL